MACTRCRRLYCLTTATYGNGRPNVFQGRTGTAQNPNQFNSVTWLGVPLDPPGTTTNRTIRMTNIRADAVFLGVSSTFTTNFIQAADLSERHYVAVDQQSAADRCLRAKGSHCGCRNH